MAIVARIIQNMNGQLQVESDVDEGTIFSLFLKYPLFLSDGTQEKPISSNRSLAVPSIDPPSRSEEKVSNIVEENLDEKGPITVIGSTTYVTSVQRPRHEAKLTPTTVGAPTSTNAVKQPEIQPKLRILYAEVFSKI